MRYISRRNVAALHFALVLLADFFMQGLLLLLLGLPLLTKKAQKCRSTKGWRLTRMRNGQSFQSIVSAAYWFEDGQGTGRKQYLFFILRTGLAQYGLYILGRFPAKKNLSG
jgi:hypothetical protein